MCANVQLVHSKVLYNDQGDVKGEYNVFSKAKDVENKELNSFIIHKMAVVQWLNMSSASFLLPLVECERNTEI